MTQATSMTQAEYLAETAKSADQRAELARNGVRLSFPMARAARLIESLQAIAERLRDLQRHQWPTHTGSSPATPGGGGGGGGGLGGRGGGGFGRDGSAMTMQFPLGLSSPL